MGRTVLHYAAGLPDAGYIYSMLTNAGAKEDAVDLVRKKLIYKRFTVYSVYVWSELAHILKGAPSEEVILRLKVTMSFLNFQFFDFYDIILH